MHPRHPHVPPRPRSRSSLALARAAALVGALSLLAACGGPQASIELTLGSDVLHLLRGGEATVEVTLTRLASATGDVTLDLEGEPDDVSWTFSPPVLSGDTLKSTLKLVADAAADEDDAVITVTAESPGLSAQAELDLEVESLTVTGQLIGFLGIPLAGVALASQDDTAVTDLTGRFELKGLSVPYEVTAWSAADKWAHVFQGLTTADLQLTVDFVPTGFVPHTATVNGSLTGGSVPVGTGQAVNICPDFEGTLYSMCTIVGPGSSDFTIDVSWVGSPERAVRLHALEAEMDSGGAVVAYPGYGSVDLELMDGQTVDLAEPIDLGEPLETKTVALDVDSPVTITTAVAAVKMGPNLMMATMWDPSGATSYTAVMPVIPGTTYVYGASRAGQLAAWVVGATGDSVEVDLPEAPTLVAPDDLATGVTNDTEFTVSNPAGGSLTWRWDAADYSVALTTTATTATIPDVSELGLPLPAGEDFNWHVQGPAGGGAEAAARSSGDYVRWLLLSVAGASRSLEETGAYAASDSRGFTTAP